MKLSDFLTGVGRPVAFYPGLAKALGGIKQAVFVCQMAYWKDKGSDPEGWIYKSSEEIEQETSLTYKEQIKVREILKSKNLLDERYARTEHQMYFRINWDAVNAVWDEHLTNGHMPNGKVAPDQRSSGSLPKVSSLNSNSENTSKNTSSIDENLAFLTSLYEKNIGMVFNGTLADELQEYSAFPRDWIERAFKEMADANVRNWRYVRKCLDSWKQAGKITEKPNSNGSKPVQDQKPAINESEVERTRQYNERRWDFVPAPPPDTRPAIKQLAKQKGIRK